MRLGATPQDGGTHFRVWAPRADRVEVVVNGRSVALEATEGGFHQAQVAEVGPGDRYGFRLDGGGVLPDPASRSQPDGVHDLSEVIEFNVATIDDEWRGVELDRLVIYELHVGTFTADGTFDAAIGELARLAALGITAIEIMPIAQFPGSRNWGYDGVYAFAAQHSYGGRAGLIRLVEAAHSHGIAVLLDVVHNHIGPEGNYLAQFGPYFTDRYNTGWGDAMNMVEPGSDAVRDHFISSAVEWIAEAGLDGLRLDAVHAIIDQTARPFLEELTDAVSAAATAQNRTAVIIAESSDNDPRFITPSADGGYGCDAVWNDDLHHGIRVALTGDRSGYYADYEGIDDIVRCFQNGWVFTGQYSIARGRRHGRSLDGRTERPPGVVPFDRLVVCDQNHDQIGNRAAGDRLDVNVTGSQRRLAAATTVLGPFTPMLFMGEEYGETAPFPYFVSHGDANLIEAVRTGRKNEFPQNDQSAVPDPADPGTFQSAKLTPARAFESPGRELVQMYSEMLKLRRTLAVLTDAEVTQTVRRQGSTVVVTRLLGDAGSMLLLNYGETAEQIPVDAVWDVAFDTADPAQLNPSSVDAARVAPWSAQLLVSGTV